jgi:hypothetical protein
MKRDGERRYDRYGEFRLMARCEGYVMCRRAHCMPALMTEREWNKLARTPETVDVPFGEPKLVVSK